MVLETRRQARAEYFTVIRDRELAALKTQDSKPLYADWAERSGSRFSPYLLHPAARCRNRSAQNRCFESTDAARTTRWLSAAQAAYQSWRCRRWVTSWSLHATVEASGWSRSQRVHVCDKRDRGRERQPSASSRRCDRLPADGWWWHHRGRQVAALPRVRAYRANESYSVLVEIRSCSYTVTVMIVD